MLYQNAWIFAGRKGFVHGSFRVENGRFTEVLDTVPGEDGIDLHHAYVIPGLIDIHTHGNSNADFSDGDENGLACMARYLAKNGVTAFAPTSMTLPYDALAKAFAAAVKLKERELPDCARVVGIHMEGPFFSEKKKGAQNGAYLKEPDFDGFRQLYDGCGGLIRVVDIAPELPGAAVFTKQAAELCTVSVAHTASDYEAAKAVFDAGASHLTHLFNAMPPIHHRQPGVIGAASETDTVQAELICDGIHVHPSGVRMAFKLFPDRICLISDALRCCGLENGVYELGGQTVYLCDGIAKLADGTIAGSAANLYDCMRNAVRFGVPVEEAIAAATINPAKAVGADAVLGSIEVGKYADFVVCKEDLEPQQVYISGLLVR